LAPERLDLPMIRGDALTLTTAISDAVAQIELL
jgi:hypothetical protein